VSDESTGRQVKDAQVAWIGGVQAKESHAGCGSQAEWTDVESALRDGRRVVTSAEGAFRFEGLASGWHILVVQAPGYARRTELLATEDLRTEMRNEIRLRRECALLGRVLLPSGAPASGCEVSAWSPWSLAAGTALATLAYGAQDGGFLMRGLEPGPCYVCVRAEGWPEMLVSTELPLPTEGLELVLPAGARVHGVVRLDGRAAPELRVHVSARAFGAPESTTTSPRGEFELRNVPAGPRELAILAPGLDGSEEVLETLELALAPGQDLELVIELDSAAKVALEGSVRINGQAPGAGFIQLVSTAQGVARPKTRCVALRADGRFTFEPLTGGPYELLLAAELAGGASARESRRIQVDGSALELDLHLGRAEGFLHDDASGAALHGIGLELERRTTEGWVLACRPTDDFLVSGVDGRFTTPFVPPAEYRVLWRDELEQAHPLGAAFTLQPGDAPIQVGERYLDPLTVAPR
jgi:hypothetical protein